MKFGKTDPLKVQPQSKNQRIPSSPLSLAVLISLGTGTIWRYGEIEQQTSTLKIERNNRRVVSKLGKWMIDHHITGRVERLFLSKITSLSLQFICM